jgi:CubicO group peptidase (beta-lactamase class C family)
VTTSSPTAVDHLKGALNYVDSWLEYRVWKLKTPGAQVAVWFDGKLQFSKAYGFSNIHTGEALTTSHLFRVASHSKTFAATAMMQLVEAGKLRLDDTAGQWIPELKAAGSSLANATVRELVSQSAGVIRDGKDSNFWSHMIPFPGTDELLQMAIDGGDIRQPEATFKYTNVGFSLLGMIIGAASGTSFNEFVTESIVNTLGLKNTGPELDDDRLSEYAGAHSGLHSRETRKELGHIDTHAMSAATGFYSTAEDMVTFATAHFFGDNRLISDRSKNEMQRTVWSNLGGGGNPLDGYGYGTIVSHYDGHRMVGHSGGYPGHITRMMWDPNEGLAISVLTNAADGPAEELASGILRILDKARELSGKLPLTSGLTNSAALTPPEKPSYEVDLNSFTGRFAGLWGVIDVTVLGGKLYATTPVMPTPLVQASELAVVDADTLKIMDGSPYGSVGEYYRYNRDSDGKIVSVSAGGGLAWPIEDYRNDPDRI